MPRAKSETVEALKIETKTAQIKIVGDTPLIAHRWSPDAVNDILSKQMKKVTEAKDARDPWMDFCNSLYWLDPNPMPEYPTEEDVANAKFGFPAIAFKLAAIDAAYQQGMINKKTTSHGAFHVIGEYAEIDGVLKPRQDMVRIGMGTADVRIRGEFRDWSTTITVRYYPKAITLEGIVSMLDFGGFASGIGDWRPAKHGTYGTFHVAKGTE